MVFFRDAEVVGDATGYVAGKQAVAFGVKDIMP